MDIDLIIEQESESSLLAHERGFTLVELLVVTAIISVVLASALVGLSHYRQRTFDVRALSDFRNIISAQEAHYSDAETFASTVDELVNLANANPSVARIINSTGADWTGSVYHTGGTKTYCYDSTDNLGIVTLVGIDQSCS